MPQRLLIDRTARFRRAVLLDQGRLADLHLDRLDRPVLAGSLQLGRVVRVLAPLNAAFVDIGTRLPGFLAGADVRPLASNHQQGRIGTRLSAGQSVLVQVRAEGSGDKGPSLTMDVSLPGRFLVHLPLGSGLSLSRRLGRGPERTQLQARLRELVAGGGWIARAGAAAAPPELIEAEADHLAATGRRLLAATTPGLVAEGPNAMARLLLDSGAGDAPLDIDGADAMAELRAWADGRAPDLLSRARLSSGLFEQADLDAQIAALARPRVPLPGGGNLMIEPTEALTAIDVNGGERGDAMAVNLEAAAEVARQLRLRNIGGIVVVDFVGAGKAAERERLVQFLSGAVADDPAGTHVYGMSKLGLVEITRTRRGPPLAELLGGEGA